MQRTNPKCTGLGEGVDCVPTLSESYDGPGWSGHTGWHHSRQTMGLPIFDEQEDYACTHGIGYTNIMRKKGGIRTETLFFVPNEGKREVLRVTVTNESARARTLKIIP